MAYSKRDDVQPPYTGGPTPGRIALLSPTDLEVLDYDESPLTPPDTIATGGVDNYRSVVVIYNWLRRASKGLLRKLRL